MKTLVVVPKRVCDKLWLFSKTLTETPRNTTLEPDERIIELESDTLTAVLKLKDAGETFGETLDRFLDSRMDHDA